MTIGGTERVGQEDLRGPSTINSILMTVASKDAPPTAGCAGQYREGVAITGGIKLTMVREGMAKLNYPVTIVQ